MITNVIIAIVEYQIIIGNAGIFDELRPLTYCLN